MYCQTALFGALQKVFCDKVPKQASSTEVSDFLHFPECLSPTTREHAWTCCILVLGLYVNKALLIVMKSNPKHIMFVFFVELS